MMPTRNHKRVKKLLKQKRAKVIDYKPYTIQLLYRTNEPVRTPPPQYDWVYEKVDRRKLFTPYKPRW